MAIVLFIVYLLSADYIFNVLIKTKEEARIENMQLPAEVARAKFYIDAITGMKIKWKDALEIKGWIFKEDVKGNKRKLMMVLRSPRRTLVYGIEKCMIPRRDVTAVYHLDQQIIDLGFEVYIPTYRLKNDFFEIGWIIFDETGKHYVRTDKLLFLTGTSARVVDRRPRVGQKPQFSKPVQVRNKTK